MDEPAMDAGWVHSACRRFTARIVRPDGQTVCKTSVRPLMMGSASAAGSPASRDICGSNANGEAAAERPRTQPSGGYGVVLESGDSFVVQVKLTRETGTHVQPGLRYGAKLRIDGRSVHQWKHKLKHRTAWWRGFPVDKSLSTYRAFMAGGKDGDDEHQRQQQHHQQQASGHHQKSRDVGQIHLSFYTVQAGSERVVSAKTYELEESTLTTDETKKFFLQPSLRTCAGEERLDPGVGARVGKLKATHSTVEELGHITFFYDREAHLLLRGAQFQSSMYPCLRVLPSNLRSFTSLPLAHNERASAKRDRPPLPQAAVSAKDDGPPPLILASQYEVPDVQKRPTPAKRKATSSSVVGVIEFVDHVDLTSDVPFVEVKKRSKNVDQVSLL